MNIAWKTLIGLTLLYLALPIVGLLTQLDLAALPGVFSHDRIYPALTLSLTSALASTGLIVAVGTPLAWKLAEHYQGGHPPLSSSSFSGHSFCRPRFLVSLFWIHMVREDFSALASRSRPGHSLSFKPSSPLPSFFKSYSQALLGETVTTQTSPRHSAHHLASSHEKSSGLFTSGRLLAEPHFLLPAHWENSARH